MEPIETQTSPILDWIGPSMNMVAKMNRLAHTNSMVVGDLHQIISKFSFQDYLLELAGELNIGIKQKYPIYSVIKRKWHNMAISKSMTDNVAPIRLVKNGRAEVTSTLPNILIVDDEHDILLVYKEYLDGQPVNVEVFQDPVQLLGHLALVGPSYYDLAILDVRMPKMSGFQVYQVLTALKPSIKALFVSALDCAGEVLVGLRGIDKEEDFIRKPVSRENFVYAVNKKIKYA
jgi:CheY-like chemotaxis protein